MGDIRTGKDADRIDTSRGILVGQIFGGAGSDLYVLAGTEQVVEEENGGIDLVEAYGDYVLGANVENLILLGNARTGVGNAGNNAIRANDLGSSLSGAGGDDLLYGGSSDDVLRGGGGLDVLQGGDGDDRMLGGGGNDILTDTGGQNLMSGGGGDDYLIAGGEGDVLDGGAGRDTADFSIYAAAVTIDLEKNLARGAAALDRVSGIENVVGTALGDKIAGSAESNRLNGGDGADQLSGALGDDVLYGGAGGDRLDGGDGIDTVDYSDDGTGFFLQLIINLSTGANNAGDTISGIENVWGTGFADQITGSDGANELRGGYDNDQLFGGGGSDRLIGGENDDTLDGGTGADVFAFPDVAPGLRGSLGADRIAGFENGVDRISFEGSTDVDSFADLTITRAGQNTLITTPSGDTIRILNVLPNLIDVTDFVF